MGTRITIVGGGSTHWAPKLLVDFANTPSLHDAEVTLLDIVPDSLPPMIRLAEHVAGCRGIKLGATATTDVDKALDGAEFVITAFSVGGFESMRHDIEIPTKFGIRQPVGDSVGPGGIARALRSIPATLSIARAMERNSPEAYLVNVSNPLTALCRAVTRETAIRTVGLCAEVVGLQFVLSLLFDADMRKVDPVVAGVNHLPLVTGLQIDGDDGLVMLRELLEAPGSRAEEPIWLSPPPPETHWQKLSPGEKWTKGDVIANNRIKFELFQRFGVLPGSADTHVSEFFGGFVTAASDFGRDWGVHQYGLVGHISDKLSDDEGVESLMGSNEIPRWASGELVAPMIDGMVTGKERSLPVNLPNRGQVQGLPEGPVVECMGITSKGEVRARDEAAVGGYLGEHLRRVVTSHELTVEAALRGDRDLMLAAMLTDQSLGGLPYEQAIALVDQLLTATSPWLPQFMTD